jgi:hypothetical protein
MAIDVDALLDEIKTAARDILGKDLSAFKGFSESQLAAIAQQTVLVETGILTGQITPATQDFFLKNLKDLTNNFVLTLQGLALITIEKLWNAVVGLLWKAIQTGTGIVLPTPGSRPT